MTRLKAVLSVLHSAMTKMLNRSAHNAHESPEKEFNLEAFPEE